MLEFLYQARQRFSNKLLDWAETLPKFQGGPIAELQSTREFQRKHANDTQKRTERPEAVELNFIGFQMFELYQIETYNLVEDRLVKLFPELRDHYEREKLASIRNTIESFGPGSFNHVGVIAKEKLFLVPSLICCDEELPETIRYISIGIHKILPSVIGVVFDVQLTDVASKELSSIQAASYLPEIEFKHLFPFSFGGRYGHKQTNGDNIKTANVLKWIDRLHYAAQKSVKPLLFGYFSKSINNKQKLLPSIEFYLIKGVPNEVLNDGEAHENWARSEQGWLNSLGFSLDVFDDVYKTSQEMLSFQTYGAWQRSRYRTTSSFSRILVLQEPFLIERNLDMHGGDIRAALNLHCGRDIMSDLMIYIAIAEFIDITTQRIEKFKSLVFHRMGSKRLLSRHIALSSALLREQALTKAILNLMCNF
jgi:hypothetical protein